MRRRRRAAVPTVLLAVTLASFSTVAFGVATPDTAGAATATQLVFTNQPSPNSVTPGQSFTFSVSVEDASNNVETSDGTDQVNVVFAFSPQGVSLQCNGTGTNGDTLTVSNGVANFSCSSDNATDDQLEATSPNDSSLADAQSLPVDVTPGTPAVMSITTQPTNASSNTGFPVEVLLSDEYGNPETTDDTDQVTLAITAHTGTSDAALTCTPKGASSPDNTATVSSGLATFTCAVNLAGLGYSLTASSPDVSLTPVVSSTFDIGQESATFLVSPDPALVVNNDSATFNVQVTVVNASDAPIIGDTVALIDNELESTIPTEVTGAGGVATFSVGCPYPYCADGGIADLTATDVTTNTQLGVVAETFGALTVPTEGAVGQSETFSLADAAPSEPLSVGFAPNNETTPVATSESGTCATNASGNLTSGSCNFTVPSVAGVTLPGDVTASVTIGTGAGAQTYQETFLLEGAPAITLSASNGRAGTVVTVNGGGFGVFSSPTVTFTPAGSTTPSSSSTCHSDGEGNILNSEGDTCVLTIPVGSALGEGNFAVTGFANATAAFDVTTTCGEDPSQAGCTLTGLDIDTTDLHNGGQDLYVGDSITLPIIGDYSDGSAGLLPVAITGPYPQVTFTAATPSSSLTYNGPDATNNGLELTAVSPSTAAATLQVTYDGLTSAAVSVSAENTPCGSSCSLVNGALLTVQAEVPGALGTSTPVPGAVVVITQPSGQIVSGPCGTGSFTNTGCTPVSTFSGSVTLSSSTCTTGDNGSDTSDAGACQVTDAVGGPDTITLFAPPDYTVTSVSVSNNGAVTGTCDASVCTISPPDFTPLTVTFDVEPYPLVNVFAAGPQSCAVPFCSYYNSYANGAVVDFVQGSTVVTSCTLANGTDNLSSVVGNPQGDQAFCGVDLPPGTYDVVMGTYSAQSNDYSFSANGGGTLYVNSTDPVSETLDPGGSTSVSFTTAGEPLVNVFAAGPQSCAVPFCSYYNSYANGAVVDFVQGSTVVTSCTLANGTDNLSSVVGNPQGDQAFCGVDLPPGTYDVVMGTYSAQSNDYSFSANGGGTLYVNSTDPVSETLDPGGSTSVSFTTAGEPLVNVFAAGPQSCAVPFCSYYNSYANGAVVDFVQGSTVVTSCTLANGTDNLSSVVGNPQGDQAFCGVDLPPGTYDVVMGTYSAQSNDYSFSANGGGTLYVNSTDPVSETLDPGGSTSVSFTTAGEPLVNVFAAGPQSCAVPFCSYYNSYANGAVVDFVQGSTVVTSCTLANGTDNLSSVVGNPQGDQAFCGVDLPPGTYDVVMGTYSAQSNDYSFSANGGGTLYVNSTDPVSETLDPGGSTSVSFTTAGEPLVNVFAAGPQSCAVPFCSYYNSYANGAVVDFVQGSTVVTSCTLANGTDNLSSVVGNPQGDQAFCGVDLPPGTYDVVMGTYSAQSNDYSFSANGGGTLYVNSTDPVSETLDPGGSTSVSFTTAGEPLVNVFAAGPQSCAVPFCSYYNSYANGAVVDFVQGSTVVTSCTLANGTDNLSSVVGNPQGDQAFCGVDLPPGTYDVVMGTYSAQSNDYSFSANGGGTLYVNSTDPVSETLDPGGSTSVSFTTAGEPNAPPTGPTNAPPPPGLPLGDYGTPTSEFVSSTTPTAFTTSSNGASVTVTVPAGALPAGTTVSVYPIINTSALGAEVPAGETYVLSFAVSWETPSDTSPAATSPITMTISDPSIEAGDAIYALTSSGLVVVGVATVDGSATVTFSSDPVFVIAETSLVSQVPLMLTTLKGVVGKPLALTTSGGSGTGALTFMVTNGTAKGCVVVGGSLSSTTAGTCVVTVTKAADPTYLVTTSPATTVSLILPARPATVSVTFRAMSYALSVGAKKSLLALSKELLPGASVILTGYARGNQKLARSRAEEVANYLAERVKIHIKLVFVSRTVTNETTVVTSKQ